jgi:RimJ/RimL family protein N-acetyltransferase
MELVCRQLETCDALNFHALRLEGFRLEPRAFRYAPEDEAEILLSEVEARLTRDYVVGAFDGDMLVGVGGLARNNGAKTSHKALLYGMYVKAAYRDGEASDSIMRLLLDEARGSVEIVTLTVVAQNLRARRFYERWSFRAYGVEARSVKIGEGDYLDETLMALSFGE